MYGSTQSPLVISAAGKVGVGKGSEVGVDVGAADAVAVGEGGVGEESAGPEMQAASSRNKTWNIGEYFFI